MTGRRWGEVDEVRDAQVALERLVAAMSDTKTKSSGSGRRGRYLDNNELIERAKAARNGEKFSRLWAGDTGDYRSPSEADCALLCLLLHWTNMDADRAEVLFSQSGLAREKWERLDYRRRTIAAALKCLREGAKS